MAEEAKRRQSLGTVFFEMHPPSITGEYSHEIHPPGESTFRSIFPEDIDWKPFAAFPPLARLAVLVGDLTQPGPHWAKSGEYVTQVTDRRARLGLEYINPKDDPRNRSS